MLLKKMKIFAFQNESMATDESINALKEFMVDKGHEVILYNEDNFETLDNAPELSRIADTAIEVAEEKPDIVFTFNSIGLIPWLYESMRIPYIDFILTDQEDPWKDLDNPDMQMYGESNYCWVYCPDKASAQTVREKGYVHTLVGDAELTDPELLGKIEAACKSIIEAIQEKAGPETSTGDQLASASLFRLACQLIFDNKWELSSKVLAASLDQNEDNRDAFYYYIAVLEKLGRAKEAKSKLTQQLKGLSEQEHEDALQIRSEAYCALGLGEEAEEKFEEAVDSYQKAIRLNDNCFLAYNNLGALLLRAENLDMAREYLQTALDIQDSYSPTYFNMALLYEQIGQYDEAIEAAETFMDLTPETQTDLLQCGRELISRLESEQRLEQ